MKLKLLYTILSLVALTTGACKEIDNYDGPTETLQGKIIDGATGQTLQGEVSGDNGQGTRIKLLETSWSSTPTPLFLATKQDGTYRNTKVFAATYNISAEGAFVPLVQTGNDKSVNLEIKGGGVHTLDFTVEPFLRLEWIGEPVMNANGTITAQVKVTRGTSNASFQQNITDLGLYLSPSEYVGNNNYDSRYSPRTTYSGTTGNAIAGTTVTLVTTGVLPKKDWFLRFGSRIDYGTKQFNYSTIKMVSVK
ncbi:DUF3823 domain-containing protein [Hufsiella ginkgonis]|uniref:DUF3823 domain-containing protein n=1 Tax=Hufsiella ginkgonis TaxID=2695274 RepID=A0A7K1XX83_9SPHI|nr:DUF3823 domain-containing protein [Hufsiella ginkgonis]MXV15428.1 DUF3823 domain-containing protein [Hufsiella ginkgonis]